MWILQAVAMARDDAPVLFGSNNMTWGDTHGAARFVVRDGGSPTWKEYA